MFPYFLLIVFWTGAMLLCSKAPSELRKRAEAVFGGKLEKGVFNRIKRAASEFRAGLQKEALAGECSDVLGYIKNIVILGRSADVSAQTLLTDLSDMSDRLRPVFADMARYMSTNDKEEAEQRFVSATMLGISRGMGRLLSGWDDLDPSEIRDTLDAYQAVLSEERRTSRRRRDEIVSEIMYFPVVLNCMLVLLNFIYVSYFIEQQENLSVLF
ncbi:MAG: hypothetical protein IJI56_04210 [Firmicutes bacterium]|nr:hypothetical protein [Bacillota bacterium]